MKTIHINIELNRCHSTTETIQALIDSIKNNIMWMDGVDLDEVMIDVDEGEEYEEEED